MTGKFIIRTIRSASFGGLKDFTVQQVYPIPTAGNKMSPLTLSISYAIMLMVSSRSVSVGNISIGAFVPLVRFLRKRLSHEPHLASVSVGGHSGSLQKKQLHWMFNY